MSRLDWSKARQQRLVRERGHAQTAGEAVSPHALAVRSFKKRLKKKQRGGKIKDGPAYLRGYKQACQGLAATHHELESPDYRRGYVLGWREYEERVGRPVRMRVLAKTKGE